MTGSCPNCLMQVDGIPNVRSCTEPARDGMRVERQNAGRAWTTTSTAG